MAEQPIPGDRGGALLEGFAKSNACQLIQNRMCDVWGRLPEQDPENMGGLRRDFAGAFYEELAYFALRDDGDPDELLSPQDTFRYFHHYLYPDRSPLAYPFTTSLDRVAIPDGLRVRVTSDYSYPTALYEYTLTHTQK